jgi:hypothetical protein
LEARLFAVGVPQASTIAERGQLLNDYFTYSLYVNVCRSLFERHKLLLSFMLAVKTLQHAGSIDPKEWRFLLAGPTSQKRTSSAGTEGAGLDNPAPDWLTEKAWGELLGLADLPAYHGLDEHVAANLEHYKAMFDSNEVRDLGGWLHGSLGCREWSQRPQQNTGVRAAAAAAAHKHTASLAELLFVWPPAAGA